MWTSENRGRYERSTLQHPSGLTDDACTEAWSNPSITAEDSPRVGRTAAAECSRSCASSQSDPCSVNAVTNPERSDRL